MDKINRNKKSKSKPRIASAPGQVKPLRGSYTQLRPYGWLRPSASAQGVQYGRKVPFGPATARSEPLTARTDPTQ